MTVRLSYELVGTGWAQCTVQIDQQQATVTASYLSDALDDLTRAVADILRGDTNASASFDEEPGEFRWRFTRVSMDRLRIQILEFAQLRANRPDNEGALLFDAECRLRAFAGALLSELQRLERDPGTAGYRQRWVEHAFPAHRIEQLRALLDDGAPDPGVVGA